MHQSGHEWKLMKVYAILGVSLLKNKHFVQNYCTSTKGIDHMRKSDATRKILAFKEGRQKRKLLASQFSSGVCSIEKFVKSGLLQILGNSLDVPQVLWRA